jgi:hypothetical protein
VKTWKKAALLTAAIAVPAFLLGPVIWPKSPDIPAMTSLEFGLFAILAAWDALLLGAGVSFLVFGWPVARRSAQPGKTTLAVIAITWVMANWWMHDNLHVHTGLHIPGTLAIEYGFHFTLAVAGLVLAYLLIDAMRDGFPSWARNSSRRQIDPDKLASRKSTQ